MARTALRCLAHARSHGICSTRAARTARRSRCIRWPASPRYPAFCASALVLLLVFVLYELTGGLWAGCSQYAVVPTTAVFALPDGEAFILHATLCLTVRCVLWFVCRRPAQRRLHSRLRHLHCLRRSVCCASALVTRSDFVSAHAAMRNAADMRAGENVAIVGSGTSRAQCPCLARLDAGLGVRRRRCQLPADRARVRR